MLDVVTVFAPRPEHPKWRDYLELLKLQKKSVVRAGHRHLVVSDRELPGYETLVVELPASLNHALLGGQIAALKAWSDREPMVILDADCLVLRRLDAVFDSTFEIGLTNRNDRYAPIQNGAMYFAAGSRVAAIQFLQCAFDQCEEHWGGDQEAIAAAVAPVPSEHIVLQRFGVRVSFLSTKTHNWSPKRLQSRLKPHQFVVHLKGERKDLAQPFWNVIRGSGRAI